MKKLQLCWYSFLKELKETYDYDKGEFVFLLLILLAVSFCFFTVICIVATFPKAFIVVLVVLYLFVKLAIKYNRYCNSNSDKELPKISHKIFKDTYKVLGDRFTWDCHYDCGFWTEQRYIKRIYCYYNNKQVKLAFRDFLKIYRNATKEMLDRELCSVKNKAKNQSIKRQREKNNKVNATKALLDEMINDINTLKEQYEDGDK